MNQHTTEQLLAFLDDRADEARSKGTTGFELGRLRAYREVRLFLTGLRKESKDFVQSRFAIKETQP